MTHRTIPPHGFAHSEFEARTARAQSIMRRHRLDALLVTTAFDFRYFSGLDMQFWESPTRPWFLIVPANGKPIAVIPEIGAPEVAERTWIQDIHTWPAPQPMDDGVSLLANVIASLPAKFKRVGMELGREMSLRMPVIDFLALRDRLPGHEFADGAPCIWEIRMVKTEAEIDRIRYICQIASDAYDALPASLSIGMTERDAARTLRVDINRRGADSVTFLPAIAGPGGVPQIICGPSDRALSDGDVLFLDTGSTFDGYFCDFDRNYAVGTISDAAKRAHDAVWRTTEAGIAAAIPGMLCEDLFKIMNAMLVDAGSLGNNIGRLGHGLGKQLTEPPSHRLGDKTVLTPGMVLTIEPGLEYAPGKMIVHEENIVIRDGGAELLTTRAPREMLQIT
ncbi:Xaa-Pro peptidase family protein [Rhodobacteraceae bacterium KMM 6894]|nr:Xaa-Pro peptidase family protein [Rhodobacteraceae bacterium KMM 6894]